MVRLWLFVLLLIAPVITRAQSGVIDSMNSESFWKTISFSDAANTSLTTPAIPATDVNIIVASNRVLQPGQVRFMSEERDNGRINYFLAVVRNGRWTIRHMDLQQAIAAMPYPDRDWVVYTEGFGKLFTNGLQRGFAMAAQHQVNVLYLDYPSYSTTLPVLRNFHFVRENAELAGDDFLPVLNTIKKWRAAGKMGKGHMTLFFHSMGNYALRRMMLRDDLSTINETPWVDNLILNAPCVPEIRHAVWIDRIKFARHIYIHYNPKDFTLAGANLLSMRRQLGQGAIGKTSKQAVYVNFYKICGRGHSNFIDLAAHKPVSPVAMAYYHVLLHGRQVDLANTVSFQPSAYSSGGGYDIICTDPAEMKTMPAIMSHASDGSEHNEAGVPVKASMSAH